jgi:uncharacterized coiled-coil protein SlyX
VKEHPVAASKAELEMRVKALETRSTRHEDDITALIDTVSLVHEDTQLLKRQVAHLTKGVDALLAHHGIEVETDQDDLVDGE